MERTARGVVDLGADGPNPRYTELIGCRIIKFYPGNEMMGATVKKLLMQDRRWVFEVEFDNGVIEISSTDAVRKLYRSTIDENRSSRYLEVKKNKNQNIDSNGQGAHDADNISPENLPAKVSTLSSFSQRLNSLHSSLPKTPIPFTLSTTQSPTRKQCTESDGTESCFEATSRVSEQAISRRTRPRLASDMSSADCEPLNEDQPCTLYKGAVLLTDGTIIKPCASCRKGHSGLRRCRVLKKHNAPNYDNRGDDKSPVTIPQIVIDYLGWGDEGLEQLDDADNECGNYDNMLEDSRDEDIKIPTNLNHLNGQTSKRPQHKRNSDNSRRSQESRRVRHNVLQKRHYSHVIDSVPAWLGPRMAAVVASHPEVDEVVDSDSDSSDESTRHTLLQWLREYQANRLGDNVVSRRYKDDILKSIAKKLQEPTGIDKIRSHEVEILRTRKLGLIAMQSPSDMVDPNAASPDYSYPSKKVLADVDKYVQLQCNVLVAQDIARTRSVKEQRRQEHYQSTNISLLQDLVSMQREFSCQEADRRKSELADIDKIKALEVEELQLLERLKKLREEISERKQATEERREAYKRLRLSERNRLYHAQKDIDTCTKAINDIAMKRELIDKFSVFVSGMTLKNDVSDECIKNNESSLSVPAMDVFSGRELCSKISRWADQNLSESTAVPSLRFVFESIRLARHLLSKYDRIIASDASNSLFDDVLHRIDPYPHEYNSLSSKSSEGRALINVTAIICDSCTIKHLVPKEMVERSYRIIKVMARMKQLELALSGSVSHSEGSHEASDEMKGVDDSCDVQVDVDEDTNDTMEEVSSASSAGQVSEGHYAIRCFDVDAAARLPDMFWESVALVHSDDYLVYLRARCRRARDMNTPFLKLKEDGVCVESDDELEFSKKFVKDDVVESRFGTQDSRSGLVGAMNGDRPMTRGISRSIYGEGTPKVEEDNSGDTFADDKKITYGEMSSAAFQYDTRNHSTRKGFSIAVLNSIMEKDFGNPPPDFSPEPHQRVWLWDTLRDRRISGNAAPYYKNLRECFARNPHFIIYHGQDERQDFGGDQLNTLRWLRLTVQATNHIPIGVIPNEASNGKECFSQNSSYSNTSTVMKSDQGLGNFGSVQEVAKADAIPEPESVHGNVRDRKRKLFFGEPANLDDRISLWNTNSESRLAGGSAPRRRDLDAYLEKHPHYIVYDPQLHGAKYRGAPHNIPSCVDDNISGGNQAVSQSSTNIDQSQHHSIANAGQGFDDVAALDKPLGKKLKVQSSLSVLSHAAMFALTCVEDESPLNTVMQTSSEVMIETKSVIMTEISEENTTISSAENMSQRHGSISCQTDQLEGVDTKFHSNESEGSKSGAAAAEDALETNFRDIDDGESRVGGNEVDAKDDSFLDSIYCKEIFVENRDDEAMSGPGWWEELECGSSDTFISPDSMESAEAAAAVVCRAVDALINMQMEGWVAISNPKPEPRHDTEDGKISSLTTTDRVVLEDNQGSMNELDEIPVVIPSSDPLSQHIQIRNVFCCVRPPGHHAGRFGNTRGCSQNGFCLLNNVAIGAMYARLKYGLRRVAVVDIDAHFGNGTADILEDDPHSFYASVHMQYERPRYFFPSSLCCTLGPNRSTPNSVFVNILPPTRATQNSARAKNTRGRLGFRSAIANRIIPPLRAFKPDIIFISAGFDGASSDPVGGLMGLKSVDFLWVTQLLRREADALCGGRLVSVLEGGYDTDFSSDGLANCVEAHVMGLAGLSSIPDYEKL